MVLPRMEGRMRGMAREMDILRVGGFHHYWNSFVSSSARPLRDYPQRDYPHHPQLSRLSRDYTDILA